MASGPEHRPGDPAPAAGLYHEVNIFGTPTGKSVRVQRGEPLPPGPLGFGWRLADDLSDSDAVLC